MITARGGTRRPSARRPSRARSPPRRGRRWRGDSRARRPTWRAGPAPDSAAADRPARTGRDRLRARDRAPRRCGRHSSGCAARPGRKPKRPGEAEGRSRRSRPAPAGALEVAFAAVLAAPLAAREGGRRRLTARRGAGRQGRDQRRFGRGDAGHDARHRHGRQRAQRHRRHAAGRPPRRHGNRVARGGDPGAHGLCLPRRQPARAQGVAEAAQGEHRRRSGRAREPALGRRPAPHDVERRFAVELEIIAAQEPDRRVGAVLGAGEARMAFLVGADLAVPARALDAPVIVELDAARDDRPLGPERHRQHGQRRRREIPHRLAAPVAHRPRLRVEGGCGHLGPFRVSASGRDAGPARRELRGSDGDGHHGIGKGEHGRITTRREGLKRDAF